MTANNQNDGRSPNWADVENITKRGKEIETALDSPLTTRVSFLGVTYLAEVIHEATGTLNEECPHDLRHDEYDVLSENLLYEQAGDRYTKIEDGQND